MTILNESSVTIVEPWIITTVIVLSCFACLFLILAFALDDSLCSLLFVFTLSFLIIAFLVLAGISHIEVHREIILDDKYPATKLLDEYEVIKQRGEIYEVELKDADKES